MFNTWTSLALSDAILAFSSFFGVFLLSQCYRLAHDKLPVAGALIAFVLVAVSSSLGTLSYGFSQIWQQPYIMLMTATKTLAPPMLAAALATLCWNLEWSKPTWWRILIGLMVGFELSRYTGYGETYLYTTSAISLAVMFAAAITVSSRERTFTVFMVTAVVAYSLAALVIGTEGQLAGYLRLDLYRYLLALGNLFAASGIFVLLKRLSRE
ncbi:hypothetical protein [Parendozoicomonas haliclonae]|uniref:Uncharacterized protein n=1 Tax=Parendozoicomonas haliclonae TaxID=1960125 RepID=A0A1X7AQ55_9GAMM|nr:hypothetical protein [Parendozoicomonas haliclonae]SMA49527.1 hypothetical protein EHSB41UT_03319 [Parendozoicomonas haliclonae]